MAKFNPVLLAPLAIFAGLGAMFYFGLTRDNPDQLPSALQGKPVPIINLTDLRSDPAPTNDDLNAEGVKLVNFWASWCGPCRTEHPNLAAMAESGITIIGINYKDDPENALAFLEELGDPFAQIGADFTGRNAIEWGVTGVPETFVIDGNGQIIMRWPGPIVGDVYERRIAPAIAKAMAE
ncbi:MAG: DsbE family thiol:disulfide interchange protein [Rhodobacteraceae bacterium]|nr:DsbE family thiol:disulfide interchange protein [Paracoccaceae bacterium]